MTARSDFNWVLINQTFNINNPTTTVEFPIEGTGDVVNDDGYLLMQARGVSSNSHRIFINNESLPGIDLPAHAGWQTWMDRIPPGILHSGNNTIRIDRIGGDNFHVFGAVVNWREEDALTSGVRSDFNWVPVNRTFSNTNPTATVEFPIEGLEDHGGVPLDDAYLLIDAEGVSSNSHRIFINNESLPGIDLPAQNTFGRGTWMDRIPPGLLHEGENTIRIDRIGNDEFFVWGVTINWRETTSIQVPRNIVHADFNWVPIKHTFNVNNPTITVEFPIEGTHDVIDDGYLLIQANGVSLNHKVFINNRELSSTFLPSGAGWHTGMRPVPEGFLQKGANTIRIDRMGNDDFRVDAVAVNWREKPIPINPNP